MAPKKWASEEQEAYLLSYAERYLAAQEAGTYHSFWPQLLEGWFKEYPEIEKKFPSKTLGDLTEEEAAMLATALEDRRKVEENSRISNSLLTILIY
jgi:hypothetical protein